MFQRNQDQELKCSLGFFMLSWNLVRISFNTTFSCMHKVLIIVIPFLSFSLPMWGDNALSDCNTALRDEEEENLLGEPSYKERKNDGFNTNLTRYESSVSKSKYFWFWQKYKIHYFMVWGFFFSGIGIYEKEKNVVFQRTQVFKNVSKNIPIPKMLSRKCFLNWTWRCLAAKNSP